MENEGAYDLLAPRVVSWNFCLFMSPLPILRQEEKRLEAESVAAWALGLDYLVMQFGVRYNDSEPQVPCLHNWGNKSTHLNVYRDDI